MVGSDSGDDVATDLPMNPAGPDPAPGELFPEEAEATPTRLGRLVLRGQALQARITSQIEEALKVMPALDLVWEVSRRFRRLNGSVLAGHLTYRLFLWLFPFVLVLVALLGYHTSEGFRLADLVDHAGGSADFAETVSEQAKGGRVPMLLAGLFGLAWATAGIIRALHYIYAQAWELPIRPRRRLVMATGRAMLGIGAATVVLFTLGLVRSQGVLLHVGGAGMSFAVEAGLLVLVMAFLPRRTRSPWDLLPGAVLFAGCVLALQLVAQYYLPQRVASSSELYGSLGIALGLLFYLWCVASLLVFGAFVNAVWFDRGEILAGRPWVADPERLPRWARSAWDRSAAMAETVTNQVTSRLPAQLYSRRGPDPDDTEPGHSDPGPAQPSSSSPKA